LVDKIDVVHKMDRGCKRKFSRERN